MSKSTGKKCRKQQLYKLKQIDILISVSDVAFPRKGKAN